MRVLQVNKFLFPRGGDAVVTLETGRLLRQHGHEVAFWGMGHPENPDYPDEDIFVSHIDYAQTRSLPARIRQAGSILYSLEAKKKFSAMIARFRPDIVHLHNFAHQISPSILSEIAARGIPAVMTMHDYKLVCPVYTLYSRNAVCEKCRNGRYVWCSIKKCAKNSLLKSILNTIEMTLHHPVLRIYRHINGFISPSQFLKNKIREMGFRRRVFHLPNPVDPQAYPRKTDGSGEGVCYFGRLSHEKGLLTLIKALRGTPVPARIVGTGPLKSQLEEQVREWKLSRVTFPGYKTGTALLDEILGSAAVVLPSQWYENNPRSILEAFMLERPVIGARIGGIPELIEESKNGFMFEPGNVSQLRNRIMKIVDHPDRARQMGKNARRAVCSNYSAETYYSGLITIYRSILSSGK